MSTLAQKTGEIKPTSPMVSLVAGVLGKEPNDQPAAAVVASIALGTWKAEVESIRKTYAKFLGKYGQREAKDAVRPKKNELFAALWCGTFAQGRKDDALKVYSGLLCADLDDLTPEQLAELQPRLARDPHVHTVFISPTGTGLKVLFAVAGDASEHEGSFLGVQAYVRQTYRLEVDPACRNVGRLCFISYDPQAQWRADVTPLAPREESAKTTLARKRQEAAHRAATAKASPKAPAKAQRPVVDHPEHRPVSEELLRELLGHIPADDRQTWLTVLGAVKLWGQETQQEDLARAIAVDWAAASAKHDADDQQRVWDSLEREQGDAVATMGTVFHLAKENGWEGRGGEQDSIIASLATFGPIDYDRLRDKYASELGCRATTLDRMVAAARKTTHGDGLARETTEPWEQPVDGGDLLNSLLDTVSRYLVLADAGMVGTSLWVMHSYCFDLFQYSPILSIRSPEPRCGKSKMLALLAALVPKPLKADSVSDAVLYRAISAWRPTLLLDEWDSQRPEMQEAIRNVLNSGFEQGGCTYRCAGDDHIPTAYTTYVPKVVAGIGELPATAASRSIVVMLHRKLASERVERLRGFNGLELRRKMLRWAADNRDKLSAAKPALPPELNDREADIWEPLLAVADLCGYGKLARTAAAHLVGREDGETLAGELLADVRRAFADYDTDRMHSEELLCRLNRMLDRPWPTMVDGRELTAHRLSKLLGLFDIGPRQVRVRGRGAKGYTLDQFGDAFARYLPENETTKQTNGNGAEVEQ